MNLLSTFLVYCHKKRILHELQLFFHIDEKVGTDLKKPVKFWHENTDYQQILKIFVEDDFTGLGRPHLLPLGNLILNDEEYNDYNVIGIQWWDAQLQKIRKRVA